MINNKNNDKRNSFGKERKENRFHDKRENFGRNTFGESVDNFLNAKAGTYFRGTVKIVRKAKPGPVVFSVSDGYLQMDAVTPDSAYEVNDVVELRGKINERAGKMQIEIDQMTKTNSNFDEVLNKKSAVIERPFSIKSERLDKMRPKMLQIAQRLRKAVLDGEAIIIRHHADTDGISSGLAIQHSIRGLMDKIGVNPSYNLYRSPSKAPFYETTDMLHDITLAKRMVNDFGQKKPIIVIIDNGSTPEDAFAHKTLHTLGYEVIVIDHHNPVIFEKVGVTSVDKYLSLHLNPYMVGLDGKTCAGMLAYEIGRMINEEYEEPLIPATSGISDRCDIKETQDYIAKTGKSVEELTDIGIAIDFVSYNLKFQSGEGLYEEIYANPTMVATMKHEVTKGMETQIQSALPYVKSQEINNMIFSHIDLEKYTVRFKYPTPGKVIGMIHDQIAEGKDQHAVFTIGYVSDMIIIRATKPVLPVATIIAHLQKTMPKASVDGGGHECAGTIRFVSAHRDEIIESIRTQLKALPVYDAETFGKN